MTTSHAAYLTVTVLGIRVGDTLISTQAHRPRVIRVLHTKTGGRLLVLSTGGIHPLRPNDTAHILRRSSHERDSEQQRLRER